MAHPYHLISYRVSNIITVTHIEKMKATPTNEIVQSPLSDILAAARKPDGKVPRHKGGERFIKGPIPWDWIAKAANISGGALKVSLAIWQLAGMRKSRKVKLSNHILEELGVSRNTKYRALSDLKNAGLISVSHKAGSSPEIELRPCPTKALNLCAKVGGKNL
jgi:hypothetical protein